MTTQEAELAAATVAYRRRVRTAGVAIVGGLIGALAMTAFLPSTGAAQRDALLIGAGTVAASAAFWYFVVPRHLFSGHRIFVSGLLAQMSLLVVIALAGGTASLQFPYYLLPVLAQIFGGRVGETLLMGTIAAGGVVGLAVLERAMPGSAVTLDLVVIRVLELATITAFACIAAATTGRSWRELAARTSALAGETEANYRLAVTDQLTGLFNSRYMGEQLDRFTSRLARTGGSLSVVAMDVDGLKSVNDTKGHAAGDAVLRAAGDSIREQLRVADLGVRVGGDEFILVLADAGADQAAVVAERVRRSFLARTVDAGVDLSYGAAAWKGDQSSELLLRAADESLYRAKRARSVA